MLRFFPVLLASMLLPATSAFAGSPMDDEFNFDDDELAFDDGLDNDLTMVRGGGPDAKKKGKALDIEDPDAIPVFELDDEPTEDFDLIDEPLDDFDMEPPDDLDYRTPKSEAPATAKENAKPGPIALDVRGKTALQGNYELSVLAIDRDAVLVELPVLVAPARLAVQQSFTLVADVFVGEERVSQVRQHVEPASLAEFGPTFAFLKVQVPVLENAGTIKMVVKRVIAEGDDGAEEELFNASTQYSLY